MAKLVLGDITNITGNESSATATLNANNQATEDALENTLSRDGTSPNEMNADLDMNAYDIINVGNIDTTTLTVGGVDVQDIVGIEGPQGPQGDPGTLQSVVAGTNISVDVTDPAAPIVSAMPRFTPASASAPASLDFHEDTDNGTNKITVTAPSAIASDKTITWPDVTGTLLVGALGSTDNRLLRADGTGGVTAQGSAVTVDDSGNVSGVGTLAVGAIASSGQTLTLTNSAAFTPQLQVRNNANDGTASYINFIKSRAGAAAQVNDGMGTFIGQALSTDLGVRNAAYFAFQVTAVDASSVDGKISFNTTQSGSSTDKMVLQLGLRVGSPTGGDKGTGTINATAVYDDNTLLTCMAMAAEFLEDGRVDLNKWDAMVPDLIIPATVTTEPVLWPVLVVERVAVDEPDDNGRIVRRFEIVEREVQVPAVIADPVYDEEGTIVDGIETLLFDEVIIPEQTIVRQHRTARVFQAMLDSGFDPRDPEQYFAKMRADEALPGMPTQADWRHNDLSIGELHGREWLAMEMLAIVCNVMWAKLKDHEARLTAGGL